MTVDAIILAGGRGTRLREVVDDRPKPMAEVAGRPFLEWLLLALRNQGVNRVILATGYKHEMVSDYFGNGQNYGLELVYAPEPAPLGTGGAVRHALPFINTNRVVVLNGDSYCPFDLNLLFQRHDQVEAAISLWLVQIEDCSRYGSVETEDNGCVTAFREKTPELKDGFINAGVYLVEKHVIESIPADQKVSLETDIFPNWVGQKLYAVSGGGPFLDIGTPESYLQAATYLKTEFESLKKNI
jgi:D-glycero-alpha-D-manno-heptose 1-phosphate guanylyltransferase